MYYKEKLPNGSYREFFRIEKHPIIKDKWATTKSKKVSIVYKLNQAKEMLALI